MGPGIVEVFCGFLPIEKDGDGVGKMERKPSPFSINSLLRLACVLLTILFVVYFVKTRLDIVEMQEQLMAMEEQVELQRLKNKDAQLSLREDEDTLERAAREKLDYAHPDERVFVDISGAN